MILDQVQILGVTSILRNELPSLKGIYLFGSGAGINFTDTSDVDLAFVSDKSHEKEAVWLVASKIADLVKRDVDLIDLKEANTVQQMEIVGRGIRLFCEEDYDMGAIEDKIYQLYITLNEDRKVILDGIKADLSVYG